MIVADTNLLVYLYITGQRTEEAEAVLRKDPAWAAPLLWRSEFRNILIGIERHQDIRIDDVLTIHFHLDPEDTMGSGVLRANIEDKRLVGLELNWRTHALKSFKSG